MAGTCDIGAVPNSPLPTGLLNISSCARGSPQYVSLPHFYQADPALMEQFHPESDLHPDQNLHSSHLRLGEDGTLWEAAVRLQVNVLYRELPWIEVLQNRAVLVFYTRYLSLNMETQGVTFTA